MTTHEMWLSPPRSLTIVGRAVETMVWSRAASSSPSSSAPIATRTVRLDWPSPGAGSGAPGPVPVGAFASWAMSTSSGGCARRCVEARRGGGPRRRAWHSGTGWVRCAASILGRLGAGGLPSGAGPGRRRVGRRRVGRARRRPVVRALATAGERAPTTACGAASAGRRPMGRTGIDDRGRELVDGRRGVRAGIGGGQGVGRAAMLLYRGETKWLRPYSLTGGRSRLVLRVPPARSPEPADDGHPHRSPPAPSCSTWTARSSTPTPWWSAAGGAGPPSRGWTPTRCSRSSTAARDTPPWRRCCPDRPWHRTSPTTGGCSREETADTDGVVPIPGAPAFMAALAGLRTPWSPRPTTPSPGPGWAAAGLPTARAYGSRRSGSGASKPDPEGFLKGAAELGFEPGDCVVFEDSEAGIAAGRAAGMRVVGVGPRARPARRTLHVRDLEQVRVEALRGRRPAAAHRPAAPHGPLTPTPGGQAGGPGDPGPQGPGRPAGVTAPPPRTG